MKYLAILIGILLVVPVYGQRKKTDEEVVPTYIEGVVYALPRTVIRVQVKTLKETFIPGPYSGYAQQLLGISNVKTRSVTSWSITDVKIEGGSEPDPAQVYKAMGEGAFLISLTSDGCIAGVNTGSIDFDPIKLKTNKLIKKPDTDDGFSFDYFTDTPFYTAGDSTNNFRPVRVSDDQKMAEAAKRVLESRRMQYDMVSGMMDEFHPDGEAYKLSLKELKNIEKKYLSLFVGRTTYSEHVFSIDFVPGKAGNKGEVIFRISDENGVVPASDLSGKPVMIEFENEDALVQKASQLAKSDNPLAGESGVYYRIPGISNVKIINDLKVIATARIPVAQFGTVAPVPEDMLLGDYVIKFHPETGAIASIEKK